MAKSKKLPAYCWDTGTLLAWLLEEESAPLSDIAAVVKEVDAGSAALVLPASVFSEVLMARFNDEQKKVLAKFRQRSNVILADMTVPIAEEAGEIRSRAYAEIPPRKLKAPDAQIAATAIAYQVKELHALDRDLLQLDGHPTVNGLAIKLPRPVTTKQRGLPNM